MARLAGKAQPLAARYAKSILPRVQRRLSRDKLRMLDLVAELDPQWLDFPADTRALFNVNTPEELARAEELAKLVDRPTCSSRRCAAWKSGTVLSSDGASLSMT